MKTIVALDHRELSTVLAALRFWQREGHSGPMPPEWDIATNEGSVEPLTEDEIDSLCDVLHVDGDGTGMLKALAMFESSFSSDIENDSEMDGADTVDAVCDLWDSFIKPALTAARGETRTYSLPKCDACEEPISSVIGCPDGREICQDCFDSGEG